MINIGGSRPGTELVTDSILNVLLVGRKGSCVIAFQSRDHVFNGDSGISVNWNYGIGAVGSSWAHDVTLGTTCSAAARCSFRTTVLLLAHIARFVYLSLASNTDRGLVVRNKDVTRITSDTSSLGEKVALSLSHAIGWGRTFGLCTVGKITASQ